MGSVGLVGIVRTSEGEDSEAIGELPLLEELIERRDELALSQVPRAPEDHEDEALG